MLAHPPLGVLSQRWLTQKSTLFNNLPSLIELGGERGPGGIDILAVQIPWDGWQGDVDLYAAYFDMLKWGLFGGGSPPINL